MHAGDTQTASALETIVCVCTQYEQAAQLDWPTPQSPRPRLLKVRGFKPERQRCVCLCLCLHTEEVMRVLAPQPQAQATGGAQT